MARLIFTLAFAAFLGLRAGAQEINATVKIITPQLQRTDRKVFDVLENTLREWLNNTKWTDDVYEPQERIKCTFTITIEQEVGENGFDGKLAVQSTRPIYGSTYDSPLLSHQDNDLGFTYDQFQQIDFARDNIDNNLTAVLAFYVYTIIGLDNDSFSLNGGDPQYLLAQQILNNIPPTMTARYSGWRAPDGGKNRNRYWLNENLLNPRVKPLRAAFYNYHRKGLDMISADPEKARATILAALEELEKVSVVYFNCMIVQTFTVTKRDELVEMWKQGQRPQRERVVQILSKIDPANAPRYREIGV
ncbi:MAG: DUF4835 family protein [Saprospiraceae bacterium]